MIEVRSCGDAVLVIRARWQCFARRPRGWRPLPHSMSIVVIRIMGRLKAVGRQRNDHRAARDVEKPTCEHPAVAISFSASM